MFATSLLAVLLLCSVVSGSTLPRVAVRQPLSAPLKRMTKSGDDIMRHDKARINSLLSSPSMVRRCPGNHSEPLGDIGLGFYADVIVGTEQKSCER
jgi:hypothetical protein